MGIKYKYGFINKDNILVNADDNVFDNETNAYYDIPIIYPGYNLTYT